MNVAGLGLGARPRLAARSRTSLAAKVVMTGTPVVGKSVKSFAPRRSVSLSVEARNIRRQSMSNDNDAVPTPAVADAVPAAAAATKAEVVPVMEPPFVGIMKDVKLRGPLYINDFVQGISFKSVVSFFFCLVFSFFIQLHQPNPTRERSTSTQPSSRRLVPSRRTSLLLRSIFLKSSLFKNFVTPVMRYRSIASIYSLLVFSQLYFMKVFVCGASFYT